MQRRFIIIVVAALMGWTSPGLAQDQAEGQPQDQVQEQALAQGTPAAAADSLRAQCEAALRENEAWRGELRGQLARSILEAEPESGDAKWRAELKRDLASEVHTEDARAMLTNKRHVVMAYAVLWILVLVFTMFLWVRQRSLRSEIARLEREIDQATAND
jgi:hypothetical protein